MAANEHIHRSCDLPFIYCCGLRPQEGQLIRTEDIDINGGKLFTHELKGHKDCIVMLTDELIQLCLSYLQVRELHGVDSEYLFTDNAGHAHGQQWVEYQFWKCWKIACVQSFISHHPRIYDFRHTFTTKRLNNWVDQKEDLYFWLPYKRLHGTLQLLRHSPLHPPVAGTTDGFSYD